MSSIENFYSEVARSRPLDAIALEKPIELGALHTPALIIDLDIFEANLAKMQSHLTQTGMILRAHTKMHKCPVVARKQMELGATGVCAAKISEAEIMCAAGVEDVLITSPVASPDKYRRLINLVARYPDVKIVVDCSENAQAINDLAGAGGVTVGVYIDIDPAMGRTGIEAGQPVLALAKEVESAGNLRLLGLQMYAGHCMHIEGHEKRRAKYEKVMEAGAETKALLETNDIEVPIFSGGGTGTWDMEAGFGLVNELQAGSYAFMDVEYRDVGGRGSEKFDDFDVSLFVLSTAISKPQRQLITMDAGIKTLATDSVPPEFSDVEGVKYHFGGDEHGIIQLDNPSREINLGDKLKVITPHCDPTVNLHEFYFPYRDGIVSEVWPVSARGMSQ